MTDLDLKELEGLTEQERKAVLEILKEYSNQGTSLTLQDIKYADYKEIPVDIETFLTDDNYLGKAWKNADGSSRVYPFWMDVLKKIFPNNTDTNYNTLLESGARGIGKSEIACGIICPYLMHRIICMKDALSFYDIKNTEKICFAFVNIKLDLANNIAKEKFLKTILMSPWFMLFGRMTLKDNAPYWVPPDPISIIIGSQADDVIGLPIFYCLDGDTIIKTVDGNYKISELVNKLIRVPSLDNNMDIITSDPCSVMLTKETNEWYELELEDGTIIKCTPEHKLMLKNGTYKEAQYLTEDDELMGDGTVKIISNKYIVSKYPKQFYDVINANPYNNFPIKTKAGVVWSHNCFADEISFIKNQSIDKQKEKAKNIIDTAVGGMVTRFVKKGKNPTMLCVASSKRSEQSFMEDYIRTLSKTQGKTTYIVDEPVWKVKPKDEYGEGIFYVGLGNKFLENIIIPDLDYNRLDIYKKRGYKILEVPLFFKPKFEEDINRNLCDIAGISTTSTNKYISGVAVAKIINELFLNPFPDIIEVGNAPDDTAQYSDFFNINNIPIELKRKPLFVHLDMSISGDMTGIAGTWIVKKRVSVDNNQSKDLYFRLAFSTSIKAPKGRQISFEKNRNFIRWLRQNGFNIKEVTSDTFQSYDLQLQLIAEGFNCSILSVDRVDTDRICKPYQYLRSCIYELRLEMYLSSRLLDEFIDIERDMNTGKIDHSLGGHKDTLDALCGSIFTASKYAEEFAFEYGEELIEDITKLNARDNSLISKAQVNKAFEEELLNVFGNQSAYDAVKVDYGFGKLQDQMKYNKYLSIRNGILSW